jgi:hypothetical protein
LAGLQPQNASSQFSAVQSFPSLRLLHEGTPAQNLALFSVDNQQPIVRRPHSPWSFYEKEKEGNGTEEQNLCVRISRLDAFTRIVRTSDQDIQGATSVGSASAAQANLQDPSNKNWPPQVTQSFLSRQAFRTNWYQAQNTHRRNRTQDTGHNPANVTFHALEAYFGNECPICPLPFAIRNPATVYSFVTLPIFAPDAGQRLVQKLTPGH